MTDEKKQILYNWLNLKYDTYEKSENEYYLYFYYKGNKHPDILIDKEDGVISYDTEFYKEFYEIIPLKYFEFEEVINKWVEDTFGLKGFISSRTPQAALPPLKILLV